MLNIPELEKLDTQPTPDEFPNEPWGRNATLGEKYNGAFAAEDQEHADFWMLMLVGHRLRYDDKALTWKKAFEIEREELAWRALAKDIGFFELYTQTEGGIVERTTHREVAARMYRAVLPARITGRKDADILERVHIRRGKSAKSKGESYWRKGHKPDPSAQGALF